MVAFYRNKHDQSRCDKEQNNIAPLYAVVFHGNEGRVLACTKHRVTKTQKLSLGQVVSPEAIQKSFAALNVSSLSKKSTFIPENVLVNNDKIVCWYKKRFVAPMWYRREGGVKNLLVEWPSLLFVANKQERGLTVFALATNSRPQPHTRLYNAPLMNIGKSGALCLGSASLPKVIDAANIEECEAALIDSQFTHTNHDYTLKNKTDNTSLYRFWRERSGDSIQRVKASDLKQYGRLEDLYSGGNKP